MNVSRLRFRGWLFPAPPFFRSDFFVCFLVLFAACCYLLSPLSWPGFAACAVAAVALSAAIGALHCWLLSRLR